MNVTAQKLIGKEMLDRACGFTINRATSPDLRRMYRAEHSPIRTQVFWVELIDIPTFVSVHLVRHKIGVEHFVKSNREDRIGYTGEVGGRRHPVNHAMLINAQALIAMARKRLCRNSHVETQDVMRLIRASVGESDKDLASLMVPDCEYRGRCCEMKSCGFLGASDGKA